MKINIQKIAYRVIPFVVACVILFSCIVVGEPVKASATSATILDLRKMAEVTEVDGNTNYKLSLSTKHSSLNKKWSNASDTTINQVLYGTISASHPSNLGSLTVTLHMPSAKELGRNVYLSCSDVPDSASCRWDFVVEHVNHNSCIEYEILQYCGFSFYDEDFDFIGSYTGAKSYTDVYWQDGVVNSLPHIVFNTGRWDEICPSNAKYFIVVFVLSFSYFKLSDTAKDYEYVQVDYEITDYSVTFGYDLANVQQDEINDAVGGMSGSAGELGAIGDQLAGVEQPNTDNLDVSLGSLVPIQAITAYVAPIQMLWDNPTLFGMLSIVIALVIVSWVFFGKKG